MATTPSWHRPQVDVIECIDITNVDTMPPFSTGTIHNKVVTESIDISDEETMQLLPSLQEPSAYNVVIEITDDDTLLPLSRELNPNNVVTLSIDITDDDTIMQPSSQEQSHKNESVDITEDTIPLPPPSREPIHSSDVIDITCETQDGSNLNLKPTPMLPPQSTAQLQESPPAKEKTSSTSPLTRDTETKGSISKKLASDLTALSSAFALLPRETSISLEPTTSRIRETPKTSKLPTTSFKQPLFEVVDCFKNSQHDQKPRSQILQQKILDEAKILAQHIMESIYKETEGVSSQDINKNTDLFNMTSTNNVVKENIQKYNNNISKHTTQKIDLQNNVGLVGLIVKSPQKDMEVTNKVHKKENFKQGAEKYSKRKKKPMSNAASKKIKEKQGNKVKENKMNIERKTLPISWPKIPSSLTVTKVEAMMENRNLEKTAITSAQSKKHQNIGIEKGIHDNELQNKTQSATTTENSILDSIIFPSSISITKHTGTDADLMVKTSEMEDNTPTCSIFEVVAHKDLVEKTECSLETECSVVNSKQIENNSAHEVSVEGNSNLQCNKNYLSTDNSTGVIVQNPSINVHTNCNTSATSINSSNNQNVELNKNLTLTDNSLTISQNLPTTSDKKQQEERVDIMETNSPLGQPPPITVETHPLGIGMDNNMIPLTAIYNHLLTLGIKKPHRSLYEKHKPKPIGKKNITGKNLHRKTNSPNNNLRKKNPKNTQVDKFSKSDVKYWRSIIQHCMNTNNFQTNGFNPLNYVAVHPFNSPLQQQHAFNLPNGKAPPQQQNNYQSASHNPLPQQYVFQSSSRTAKLQQQHSFHSQNHMPSLPQQHILKPLSRGASLQQENPYKSPSHEAVLQQQQVFQLASRVATAHQQRPFNSSNRNAPVQQQHAFQSPNRETMLQQQHAFNSPNHNEPMQMQHLFNSPSYESSLQQQNCIRSPSRETTLQQQHSYKSPNCNELLQPLLSFNSSNRNGPLQQQHFFKSPHVEAPLQPQNVVKSPGHEASLQHSQQQNVFKSPGHEAKLQHSQQQHVFKSPSRAALLKHLQQQQVHKSPSHEASLQQQHAFNPPTRKESKQKQHVSQSPNRLVHLEQQNPFNSPSREAVIQQHNAYSAPKYQPLLHQEYAYKSPNHQIPFQQVHKNKSPYHETTLQQDCVGKLTHKTSLQQEKVSKSPKYQALLHPDLAYKSPRHETSEQEHANASSSHQALLTEDHASTSKQQVPMHLQRSNKTQLLFDSNKSPRHLPQYMQQHDANKHLVHEALMPQRKTDDNSQLQAFLRYTLSPKTNLDNQLNYLNSGMMTVGGVPNLTALDYQKLAQEVAKLIQNGSVNDSQQAQGSAKSDANFRNGNNAFTAPKCPPPQLASASAHTPNVSRSSTVAGHKRSLSSEKLQQETFGTKNDKRNRSTDG